MWINRNVCEKPEPLGFSRSHQQRLVRSPTHCERPLDDRAGRTSENNSTTIEQPFQCSQSPRVEVRVGKTTGIPRRQINASGSIEWRYEHLRVSDMPITRVN